MQPRLLSAYRRELHFQCRVLLAASDRLGVARRAFETFDALQALLTAGANIAKILWGQGGKKTPSGGRFATWYGLKKRRHCD